MWPGVEGEGGGGGGEMRQKERNTVMADGKKKTAIHEK